MQQKQNIITSFRKRIWLLGVVETERLELNLRVTLALLKSETKNVSPESLTSIP